MTREEVLLRMTEVEPEGKWAPIERYADLLAELERMLSDREMEVLVNAGARQIRDFSQVSLSNPCLDGV